MQNRLSIDIPEGKTETSLPSQEQKKIDWIREQHSYNEQVANCILREELVALLKKHRFDNPTTNFTHFGKDHMLDGLYTLSKKHFEIITLNEIVDCIKHSSDVKVFNDRFPCDNDNERQKMIRELAALFHKPPTFLENNPRFKALQKYK